MENRINVLTLDSWKRTKLSTVAVRFYDFFMVKSLQTVYLLPFLFEDIEFDHCHLDLLIYGKLGKTNFSFVIVVDIQILTCTTVLVFKSICVNRLVLLLLLLSIYVGYLHQC